MLDIAKLLAVMAEHDASDLYLTVDSPPMYRINGIVRPAGNRMLSQADTEMLANSIMSDRQQREFQETNEMNLALYYKALGRFRVNIFRQRGCVGIVSRRIKSVIPTVDELGLPSILKDISMTKRGLVLVVGATGCGKSTTLAAMIDYRSENAAGHIVSVEDPIEFVHEHKKCIISQREIGMDTEDYKVALKNTLRQAPDVILIGEIRDTETMEAAITFAETGHLCLSTLHSNNANQAMERIMNFFPPERHNQIYMQLSLNLRSIISQRLVQTIDGGRIAAVEILLDSPRIKDLIHKGQIAEIREAMEKSTNVGMQTFDQHLYEMYKAKKITLDEALKNADSQNNLRLQVKLTEEGLFDEKKAGQVSKLQTQGEGKEENLRLKEEF
ncbi:MAG: PilT/PilU family type 4a pilus ATPase [SAR324 cluster bacterium]|uniref:PilT/PilU family type 4a pilus ATPase n=1 Tax=SAR324 cluster bacterium TaxID=2024889 RepID=A0A7X9ILN4_9DELT|nr:PilT/PilU family type 4a pilus ATPase [SAR324 cluster bacterium]